MHGHDHGSYGHSHRGNNETAIGLAALLTGSVMVAEVVGGLISGSLALLADAGLMLTPRAINLMRLRLYWMDYNSVPS